MDNRQLTTLLVIIMIISGILGYIFSTIMLEINGFPPVPYPNWLPDPGTVRVFIISRAILGFINLALMVMMFGIYLDIYRKIRTKFTLGLLTMITLLLLNALTSHPLVDLQFGLVPIGPGPFFALPSIFTTIALLILFYLSLE